MAGEVGLEPTTHGLTVRFSTVEILASKLSKNPRPPFEDGARQTDDRYQTHQGKAEPLNALNARVRSRRVRHPRRRQPQHNAEETDNREDL